MSELENGMEENLDEDFAEDQETNELDDNSDENLNITDGEKQSKNPSNFKKLSKAYKGALAKIKELEKGNQTTNNSDDLRLFFLENPGLTEYKTKITELKNNPKYSTLDMEDLVELAKLKTPKQSQDSEDFNIKSQVSSGKKTLADLTDEEALKLDNKTYFEWSQMKKGKTNDIWG